MMMVGMVKFGQGTASIAMVHVLSSLPRVISRRVLRFALCPLSTLLLLLFLLRFYRLLLNLFS